MPPKRKAFVRASTSEAPRRRPKGTTRSTYASASEPVQDTEEMQEEEVPHARRTTTTNCSTTQPNPHPEEELQQLRATTQQMHQERDRLAVAFTTNQRGTNAVQQAAEVKQLLAISQAEIQSLQPIQQPSNNSNQPQLQAQSLPNLPPNLMRHQSFGTLGTGFIPKNLRHKVSTIRRSPKLPLATIPQTHRTTKIQWQDRPPLVHHEL